MCGAVWGGGTLGAECQGGTLHLLWLMSPPDASMALGTHSPHGLGQGCPTSKLVGPGIWVGHALHTQLGQC